MSHLEYCACGHPIHPAGKPCRYVEKVTVRTETAAEFIVEGTATKEVHCPCPSGVRVDLATFRVLADQTAIADQCRMLLAEQSQTLARILAVLEEASGLKSRLVDAGNGRARVEVKPKIVVVGG